MEYKVVTDKIEVRSLNQNNKPRYIVNGTAILANKKHIHDYIRKFDGSVKSLKNLFTPHCIESIRKQSKHKSMFVDTQHELVRNASIKALVKGKLNPEEQVKMNNMLKGKMIPLAKINDISINGDSLEIQTELNPMFREIDEDHQRYFDAVWHSLENKYLNGISINMGSDWKIAKDEHGDTIVDDIDIMGFSYVDAPAGHEHSITEVAIRAIGDGITEGEKKMEDEKKQLEDEKKKLEEEKKAFEDKKVEDQKAKEVAEIKAKEDTQKSEMDKLKEEQAKTQKELDEKTEAMKKLHDEKNPPTGAKGIVSQQPNPNTPGTPVDAADEKFYKEKLGKITAKHDHTIELLNSGKKPLIDELMNGFGELINLQLRTGSNTADLSARDAEDIKDGRFLDRGKADLITPKLKE